MLNPLRVLPHKQTIGFDGALAGARPIVHALHLAVMVLLSALTKSISILISPTASQNIDSWLFIDAVTSLEIRVKLCLASVKCVHRVVIG